MTTYDNPGLKLAGKRLLIFDFDGTLADTSPLHARAFVETLTPLGVPVDYPRLAGLKTRDAMEKAFRSVNRASQEVDVGALVAEKQRRVRELIEQELKPSPRIDAFLRWAQMRFRLAMVTSGSRGTIDLALRKLRYENWFDPLICAEDVERAKPEPEGFLKALELAQCEAPAALIFEDSESGFAAARAAGIEFIDVANFDWLATSPERA
jgi:HAD superfamily hydrolase (TIGR01509 family)